MISPGRRREPVGQQCDAGSGDRLGVLHVPAERSPPVPGVLEQLEAGDRLGGHRLDRTGGHEVAADLLRARVRGPGTATGSGVPTWRRPSSCRRARPAGCRSRAPRTSHPGPSAARTHRRASSANTSRCASQRRRRPREPRRSRRPGRTRVRTRWRAALRRPVPTWRRPRREPTRRARARSRRVRTRRCRLRSTGRACGRCAWSGSGPDRRR